MTNEAPQSSVEETATIHLSWPHGQTTFAVPVPAGPSTILDLLPAARVLARAATSLAIDHARSEGREVSCRAGCGACCRQLVAISMVEAQALADLVEALPSERQSAIRQRFADALARLEQAGLLDPRERRGDRSILAEDRGSAGTTLQELSRRYFQLQVACPMLENESCSIHEERPLVCREHHVTTPAANCARLHQVNVDRLEPAVRVGEALARAAARVGGHGAYMVPLVLSLEFAEAHGPELKKQHDGKHLFEALMAGLRSAEAV